MCEHRVTGAACHCSGCHRTFTSISGFDLHQRLQDGRVICLDPMTLRTGKGAEIFAPDLKRGCYALAGHREF